MIFEKFLKNWQQLATRDQKKTIESQRIKSGSLIRRGSQVVRPRSAKPLLTGSIPVPASLGVEDDNDTITLPDGFSPVSPRRYILVQVRLREPVLGSDLDKGNRLRRHSLLSVSAEIARNAAASSVDKSDPGGFSGAGAAIGLKNVKVGCMTTWNGSGTPSDTGPSMLISVLILRRGNKSRGKRQYSGLV